MAEDSVSSELAGCPFCGNEKPVLRTNTHAGMSWVACDNCGLEAPTETGVSADDAVSYWNRRSTIDGEPVATQYRYWYSSGEPGVWLNERRKDADDLLESGVLIREETRALYLGDSEAGAETSLRNVQTTTSGLSPFAGWQNYQHQRAACAAVFRDGWSMEDENTLIDLVTRTWPRPSPAKTSTGE